jgi:exonuclease SbcD
MRFRFLHAADLHLDSPFRGLAGQLPEGVAQEVRRSTFKAYEALVELAVKERVDFVILAGDVYDLADRSLKAQVAFWQGLKTLAEHGIRAYVCHGNHDPLDGTHAQLRWPETVHVFSGEKVEAVPFVKEGLEVARLYGRSYPTAKFRERIVREYVRDPEVPFAIGVLHTNLDGDDGHEAYAPSTRAELIAAGMDYWALGHIHKRAVVQERPFVVYPGNLQGRSRKETGAKGCYLVEVEQGAVVRLQFCELAPIRWEKVVVDLSEAATEAEVLERVEERILRAREECGHRPMIAAVELAGSTPLHRSLKSVEGREDLAQALQELTEDLRPWVWIESIDVRTREEIKREALRESDPFLGDFLRLVEEMRANPMLREELRELLGAVYRHPKWKRYLEVPSEERLTELLDEAEDLVLSLFAERRDVL